MVLVTKRVRGKFLYSPSNASLTRSGRLHSGDLEKLTNLRDDSLIAVNCSVGILDHMCDQRGELVPILHGGNERCGKCIVIFLSRNTIDYIQSTVR